MSIPTTYEKTITYDHGDYRAELDGRLIGYYPNNHSAEVALDQLVYDMLTHGDCATAEALDGGMVCSTCGNDGDCPDCGETPLFDDIRNVLDMALGSTHGAASVVAELRRIRARILNIQDRAVTQG